MRSHNEDVLHKLEFKKIIKNSPKTNFEECINPPSLDESYLLVKSNLLDLNFKENKEQQQINQYLIENCEKWIETQESPQQPASLKQKFIKEKFSPFSQLIKILIFLKYLIDFFSILLNIFCGICIPFLNLIEDYENIRNTLYFLISFHFFTIIIQNQFSYLQLIKTKQPFCEQKFCFLNEITLKNLAIIILMLIYLLEKVDLVLEIISLYYFNLGYKMVEIFTICLIIQRKKFYRTLGIQKAIVYYIYFLHLFTSFFQNSKGDGDFLLKYQESLIININFLTFQANYTVQDSTQNFDVIINQITALLLMFYAINNLIQIQSYQGCIQNQIKFDIHVLQFYFWHHKGQILKKLRLYSEISNREINKEQLAQKAIIKKIYLQILKDNLKVLELFSKQFKICLSSKVQSIRRNKEKLKKDKNGLYLILKGKGYQNLRRIFKCQKQIESEKRYYGLINCFQKNISEVELELDDHFLLLYIKQEDFYSSLTLEQDIESYHLIKNKIIFEGETSLLDYRCLICNQFHLEGRCKVIKLEVNLNLLNELNIRMKFKNRLMKKRQRAFKTYVKFNLNNIQAIHKQNGDATIDWSESSANDSCDQFEIHPEDGSTSQKFTDKNSVTSKGNDGFADFNKLYEKFRNCHTQQQASNHSSQYMGEMIRSDFRSIPLQSSQYKFQEILAVDDIDSLKEYAYFYPEFNISYIIKLFEN
ncbi:unnamed protein product (macronuclear) [Paramecium tetraurelia]|uniref:Transmembrane protein n=1 Tax=Paramecium tetraurelia TaxID=5888 RepID=A0BH14_PARTE|nr:uncharacterized protein GSPATT00028866001 [Paramecium tetraurelia]CAK57831.1 unnamed protein product [Paramecium tetraurelia]|eukprot:XP_001425229.1 hypothetical protein (macronuclear) [Paramecium tetraurelia strain d4-2]